MSFYEKHLFFCINQKDNGKKCCQQENALDLWAYAKQKAKDMGLETVRVNKSGCLGRCSLGPCIVVYPEGVWYTYECEGDVDRILTGHIVGGEIVSDLLIDAI